ncbi:MAG: putative peptidoglycan glycosyltransferase FtsW [Microgenomates group bacterium]|nr:putative peptidoglycan glycosyltransferase FtsW [Microgenomates group bacterium]
MIISNSIKKRQNQKIFWLFFLPLIISIIGVFFVFEASSIKSFNEYRDSFRYLKLQLIWVGLGVLIMFFMSLFDYHRLYYWSLFLMILTIFLLFLVLLPGIGHQVGGARRWFDFGFFNFQPTELAKLSIIIYLSSWFINRERKRFFSFLILVGLLMFLIILQPDMGTATIIFFISIAIYFLAGIELFYLIFLIPIAGLFFLFLIKISPYRLHRLFAFFNPKIDPLGITYHINQILISLANGGIFGRGFGASRQKYLFLPEAHTDSIFAIIGEEMGFLGSSLLIILFFLFSYQMFKTILVARDRYGRLLAGGIFAFFNFQILVNLAGMVNLIPLTGVPLPFISYGGSNLLVSFFLLGILINITKQSRIL